MTTNMSQDLSENAFLFLASLKRYREPEFGWASGKSSCQSSTKMEPIISSAGECSTTGGIQNETFIRPIYFDLYSFIEQEVGLDGLIGFFQLHYSRIR